MRNARLSGLAVVFLAACVAPAPAAPPVAGETEMVAATEDALWNFNNREAELREASCGDGDAFLRPEPIEIEAEAIAFEPADAAEKALWGVRYAGGWALTSPSARFGGLSGLEVFPSGNLLSIADNGAWVWINLDMDAMTPADGGYIAQMRRADGGPLEGKSDADAEGLALLRGLALVSFERDHRIIAFDLEGCGAAARSALVANIPRKGGGFTKDLPANSGPEALALTEGGHLITGFEQIMDEAGPIGLVRADGSVDVSGRIDTPGGLSLTGFDVLGDTLYSVHRLYAPVLGNRIAILAHKIVEDEDGVAVLRGAETLALLDPKTPIDNFEGIAALAQEDGGVRLFLISDDNFSRRQQTLLFAFDVVEQTACIEDREALLALDEDAFDRDLEGGWRSVAAKDECNAEAADLIEDYRAAYPSAAQGPLMFHEAQLRGLAGQTDRAAAIFREVLEGDERESSRLYAEASIAILEGDRQALERAYESLKALPEPPGWSATAEDFEARHGVRPRWPNNIGVVEGFRDCFDEGYLHAYTKCNRFGNTD
ncbi:MAG: esterase-like activity of phytase family protein [Pseudomonadota bacterium]